ncbi:MAG: hypothetical protein GF317_19025 [Candidatus Lokiarchaeota archaeon]|nr:hypothetical protein [Candidatus Lokiarchaeota archaeon]
MVVVFYWVRSEEERLTFYEYYWNPQTWLSPPDSIVLFEPITLDDGKIFGEKSIPSIVLEFDASENRIKDMIEKNIVVKERILLFDNWENEESYNKFKEETFVQRSSTYRWFDGISYDMISYLHRLNYRYIDGSIPSYDLMELENWLIYLPSKSLLDTILDALFEENKLQNEFSLSFIRGILETKDGRAFGKENKFTLFLKVFTTFHKTAVHELIEKGIIEKRLAIQQRYINDSLFQNVRHRELLNMTIFYVHLNEGKFKYYFSKKAYRFEDGSRLTLDNADLYQRKFDWWVSRKIKREDYYCPRCKNKFEHRTINFREKGRFCNLCWAKLS